MLIIIRSVNRYFAASDEDKIALGYLRYHKNQIHRWNFHQTILRAEKETEKVRMKLILALVSLIVTQTIEKDADYEAELAAFEAEIKAVEARELAEFLGLTTLR